VLYKGALAADVERSRSRFPFSTKLILIKNKLLYFIIIIIIVRYNNTEMGLCDSKNNKQYNENFLELPSVTSNNYILQYFLGRKNKFILST
jgi:hypothetical protein